MSKYRPNYAIQLGNQLFASILNAPRAELLDVEIASDHDIELELVHRTLDRYVSSERLIMTSKPNQQLPQKPLRLYAVAAKFEDKPLQPAEAPMRMPESVSAAGAKPKPKLPVEPVQPAALEALHKPVEPQPEPVAPPSKAAPSERPPVEAVKPPKPPAAKPAASKEKSIMPRGVYPRDPSAPKAEKKPAAPTSHMFSCALFDDDRLIIRAGGKAVELTPEETERLASYMRRIGVLYEVQLQTAGEMSSLTISRPGVPGVNIDGPRPRA